ncbi:MAG TPA: CBS domain-containing protein [Polyangiaceae bacterium]|jgi:CBS domain-containing protein|nr:CBS domain-containing protein [Polyangiaceae bacterium]
MPSATSEFDDAYDDLGREPPALSGEVLDHPIRLLEPREAVLISSSASVAEAVVILNERKAGCVLVMEGGKLVGIFTDRDIVRRVLPTGLALDQVRVGDHTTKELDVLTLDDSIAFALNRMSAGDSRHVPLVDAAGHPLAVVSVRDVVNFVVRHFAGSVHNLPPAPPSRSSDRPPHGAA